MSGAVEEAVRVIDMKRVNKSYGLGDAKVQVLKNVDFTVNRGEFVAILGPSGSGKSTLMNILGLIDTADSGRYHLTGEDMRGGGDERYSKIRGRRIGFVFQRFNLISKYTAEQNVAQPLLLRGMRRKPAIKQARRMLAALGLRNRFRYRPNQLSGGQQQRVAIARALIGNPDIILADEPTGALDQQTGREVMEILKQLAQKGKTIILITHDLNVAAFADRVVTIADGVLTGNAQRVVKETPPA